MIAKKQANSQGKNANMILFFSTKLLT